MQVTKNTSLVMFVWGAHFAGRSWPSGARQIFHVPFPYSILTTSMYIQHQCHWLRPQFSFRMLSWLPMRSYIQFGLFSCIRDIHPIKLRQFYLFLLKTQDWFHRSLPSVRYSHDVPRPVATVTVSRFRDHPYCCMCDSLRVQLPRVRPFIVPCKILLEFILSH